MTRLRRIDPVFNLVVSWAGAVWLVASGWVTIGWWLPLGGGVVVAIVGDWLTKECVPIPGLWLGNRSLRWGLGAFRSGSTVEMFLVAPALTLATALLAARAVAVAA